MPKFCQQVIFMENLLNNDKVTLSLILDWTAALQERAGLVLDLTPAFWQEQADTHNGAETHLQVPETHLQKPVPDFHGRQMHFLFKDIARELLYAVTQNRTSSLGSVSLEELLFQRLKPLL
jgi:hypothetical protein